MVRLRRVYHLRSSVCVVEDLARRGSSRLHVTGVCISVGLGRLGKKEKIIFIGGDVFGRADSGNVGAPEGLGVPMALSPATASAVNHLAQLH